MLGLAPSLEAAILKTLAKDPAERFFDFSLFLDVIQSTLSPPPAFPLVRSNRSRRNRAMAHSVRLAEASDISSSISDRAGLPDPASQPLEVSGVSFSAEIDVVEPMNTASLSQASMPEWTGIIPFPYESLTLALQSYQFISPLSEKADPIDNGENESPSLLLKVQEPKGSSAIKPEAAVQVEFLATKQDKITWTGEEQSNDLLLNNLLVLEETDAFPVVASVDSFHGYSEYAASEVALAFTEGVMGVHRGLYCGCMVKKGSRANSFSHSIVALIAYIFLPLVMPIPNTSLHTTNSTRMVIPQTTSISVGTSFSSGHLYPNSTGFCHRYSGSAICCASQKYS